jgi:hypothetical protein
MIVFRTFNEYLLNVESVRSKLKDLLNNGEVIEFDYEYVIFQASYFLVKSNPKTYAYEVLKIFTDKNKDETLAWFSELSQACRYVHIVEVFDYDWYLNDEDIPYWEDECIND